MELNDIKKWMGDPNERFIFVEDGAPRYVLMGFEAYRALKGSRSSGAQSVVADQPFSAGDEPLAKANAELEAERLRAQQELAAKMAMDAAVYEAPRRPMRDPAEIRLEDLPL